MSFTILGLLVTIRRAPLVERIPRVFRRPSADELLEEARLKAITLHAIGDLKTFY